MTNGGQLESRWFDRKGSAEGLVVITHGWQRSLKPDAVRIDEIGEIYRGLVSRMENAKDWNLGSYHWEDKAYTGPFLSILKADYIRAVDAASNAQIEDVTLANAIRDSYPNIKKLHLISHSAGVWVMERAILLIASRNRQLKIQSR